MVARDNRTNAKRATGLGDLVIACDAAGIRRRSLIQRLSVRRDFQ
ncbi:hypothetical protein RB1457 [Rhodopirellula baltica SH 1]|uniref:Uncharacterized protein n=1 Tax=Rhodopirellula baltica (strain DSM 10527 / NCIMB 13988 / SH1) TaxID=243090 RepID=Q7UXA7_RHOBA|nr:hypothetical protein RB1457 [Rhodopirellula baltica SH 1]